MSMPTKGKHHHLSHHHQHHSQQQTHHNPTQHQPQLLVNVNQPSVHSPQPYSTVVTGNTPRFVLNAGKYISLYPFLFYPIQCFFYTEFMFSIFLLHAFIGIVEINRVLGLDARLCFEVRTTMRSMWLAIRKIL